MTQEGHPVIFVSRCLSKSEQNYSNIEREALAIVWATMRLKQFLMGRNFTIQTDHQPLIKLFGKHPIPTGTSARICKWALDLMSYDYDIEYIPARKTNFACGCAVQTSVISIQMICLPHRKKCQLRNVSTQSASNKKIGYF